MHLKGVNDDQLMELFPHELILAGYRGSIAHNMYIPNTDPNSIDDKDIMGITIAPMSCYFGLDRFDQKETMMEPYDVVVYEIRKYVRLLIKSNPNVLSLLWLQDNHYLWKTEIGQRLVDMREMFVSKAIYKSFTGYAYGQLKRMEHCAHQGYMGKKRKALVEKYGYDCKNAAHLVRLLRMGIEFLNEGVLYVWRHDAPQLLEIKRGEWTLGQVKKEADYLFKRAETAYDQSKLPNKVDYNKINKWLTSILQDHFVKD